MQSFASSALSGSGMGNQASLHDSVPSSSSSKLSKLSVIKSSQSSEQANSEPLVLHSSISQPDVIHISAKESGSGTIKSLSTLVSLPESNGQTVNLQTYFTDQDLNSATTVPTPGTSSQDQSSAPVSSNAQPPQKPVNVHHHRAQYTNGSPAYTTQSTVEESDDSETETPLPSTIVSSGTVTQTISEESTT